MLDILYVLSDALSATKKSFDFKIESLNGCSIHSTISWMEFPTLINWTSPFLLKIKGY